MAVGDVQNFVKRLNEVLPKWFGEESDLLQAFLTGFGTTDAFVYSILGYVENQMRIQTSTDVNLDLEACDYYGNFVQRQEDMTDALFRKIILGLLLAPMATRQGMSNIFYVITGFYPIIWEPWQSNISAYNVPIWGYNTFGAYGGGNLAYNFWIEVFVSGNVMDNFGAYNNNTWGYNALNPPSNGAYGSSSLYEHTLTYDEILAIVNRVKVGGTVPHLTVTYL